jgi:DHA1 family inner membrane transport protein
MAIGCLAFGTGEFTPMAILPVISEALHEPLAKAGHIISAYALGVVFGAPLVTICCAKVPRRAMLIGLMLVFALANLASACATGYAGLLIARFASGLPHGAYFGVCSLVAAALAPPNKRGRAIGQVMLGLTIANIFGVPLATWVGQRFGWQFDFFLISATAVTAAAGLRIFLPAIQSAGASLYPELTVVRRLQVWLTLAMVGIGFGGLFAVYTYITPILSDVGRMPIVNIPELLSVFGVGMTFASVFGGWLADRSTVGTICGVFVWSAVALVSCSHTSTNIWAASLNLFAVGQGIAAFPAIQTRLMAAAGEAHTIASALLHAAFNVANALGAWMGGVVIGMGYGLEATGWVGAVLAAGGLAVLWLSVALSARRPLARPATVNALESSDCRN